MAITPYNNSYVPQVFTNGNVLSAAQLNDTSTGEFKDVAAEFDSVESTIDEIVTKVDAIEAGAMILHSAGMRAETGGGQSIATATWTKLDWVATLFADNGIVSDVTTDDDFTILVTGTYEITLWISCSSVLANSLRLSFDVSGGATYTSRYKDLTPVAALGDKFHASWAVDLVAGATVDLWLYHTEGANRTFMGNLGNQCWIKRIG